MIPIFASGLATHDITCLLRLIARVADLKRSVNRYWQITEIIKV